MAHLALDVVAVLAVLCAFGLAPVLALCPAPWRPWWPLLLPIAGLASLTVAEQWLGTIFSVGGSAIPALVLAVVAGLICAVRVGIARPRAWALVALVAVVPAGALAYRPSLRLHAPRPSGILNEDSIYYLSVESWLDHHGIRDAPPPPDVDGFYAPAWQVWHDHVRVGVDMANLTVARLLAVDPSETLPALTAVFVALVGLAAALLVVALRGPPWAAALAAFVAALRPDALRLGLESYVAQAAGVALVVTAIAAIALALRNGGRREPLLAGLLVAGLVATYVEYAPFLVVVAVALLALLLLRDVSGRSRLLWRASAMALVVIVIAPLAVIAGLRSLSGASGLSGQSIVPYFGLLKDVSLVTGPFSVVRGTGELGLAIPVLALSLVLAALLHLGRAARPVMFAALAGSALFVLEQAALHPYSYGLYKALGVIAPLALVALVLAVGPGVPRGLRLGAAAALTAILVLDIGAARDVSRLSVDAMNGMVPDDRRLAALPRAVPGVRSVALEGTDLAGTPNARQHFGVYWLRKRDGLRVTYARGPGSYFATSLVRGAGDVDGTYRSDYADVVSWGPSLTHGAPLAQLGNWFVYARAPVDLLLVGRDGWTFPVAVGGAPVRWSLGKAFLWANAPRPVRAVLQLTLVPPNGPRRVAVVIGGRTVAAARVARPRTITTKAVDLPAGRTIVELQSSIAPPEPGAQPLGAGLQSARALLQD